MIKISKKKSKNSAQVVGITDIVDPPLDIIYEKYPKYRILARNEIIKHGDEFKDRNGQWYKTNAPGGYPAYHQYRRRVKK